MTSSLYRSPLQLMIALWISAGVLITPLSPRVASAQGVENPRYKAKLSQSQDAEARGDYAKAAELLRQALSLVDKPSQYYKLGELYKRAGKRREALESYRRFVDQAVGDPNSSDAFRQIKALQAQLRDQYQEVMINSQPTGAYIYINSRADGVIGQTPHQAKLLPGRYQIIAELDGFITKSQELVLTEGAASQMLIVLNSEAEVAPVRLMINVADATVYIDNERKGRSPFQDPLLLKRGFRTVRVEKAGFKTWTQKVTVKAQKPMTLDIVLEEAKLGSLTVESRDSSSSSALPWVIMGTGAALLGGSVYTGFAAQGLYDDLESLRGQRRLISPDDIDVGNQYVLFTNILIGLGVTSLATGGVLWALEPSPTEKPRAYSEHERDVHSAHVYSGVTP